MEFKPNEEQQMLLDEFRASYERAYQAYRGELPGVTEEDVKKEVEDINKRLKEAEVPLLPYIRIMLEVDPDKKTKMQTLLGAFYGGMDMTDIRQLQEEFKL